MIDLSSSIISSTIATVLLYPAQRIRIQMQLHTKNKQITNKQKLMQQSQLLIKTQKHKQIEKKVCKLSLQQTCQQIYKKGGWKGFYSGLQSLVIGNGLSYGVYFFMYQKCKQILGFQAGSALDTIKCSSIAGIVASIATNPFWVLQTQQSAYRGTIIQKGKQLINKQGILSFWKGLSSSLILVTNPIIQFVIYEQLKKMIKVDKNSKINDLIIFLIVAISKIISTLCTYPITVIRTKQHVNKDQKKSWRYFVKNIIQNQGILGLFKGIQPKLLHTVLNSAILITLFQRIKNMLLSYYSNKSK